MLKLTNRLAPALMPAGTKSRKAAGRRPGPQELAEMWRCAASLSRIPEKSKIQLGETLLKRLRRPPHPPYALWAVARIGARVPFYGPLHTVVSQSVVAGWIEQLLDRVPLQANSPETGSFCFALALLARRSGDRHRDITDELRSRVVNRLRQLGARERLIQLVSEVTELDATEQRIAFGESLPNPM